MTPTMTDSEARMILWNPTIYDRDTMTRAALHTINSETASNKDVMLAYDELKRR